MALNDTLQAIFIDYMKENNMSFNTGGVAVIYRYINSHDIKKITQLDRVFDEYRHNKENVYKVLMGFYRYYEKQYQVVVDSQLYCCHPIDNPMNRRTDLIKRIQSVHDKDELAQYYMIDKQTINRDLYAISQMLDMPFDTNNLKNNIPYHPVSFVFTTKEVVFLTYGLLTVAKDNTLFKDIINNIILQTYNQLTDYTKESLQHLINKQNIKLSYNNYPIFDTLIDCLINQYVVSIHYLNHNQDYYLNNVSIAGYDSKYTITVINHTHKTDQIDIREIISVDKNK